MPQILRFPLQLRFGDEDSYGHVNNVRFLQYLEDARISFLHAPVPAASDEPGGPRTFSALIGEETFTLVGRHEIEYLAPLNYRPAPVEVSLWITAIGNSSFDVGYTVAEDDGSAVYARAASTMVLVNRRSGTPVRITEDQRGVLESLLGDPVPFRRREKAGV